MCHAFLRDARFWLVLLDIDRDIAQEARQGRCRLCGGPLHCAHYRRKPRGVEAVELSLEFRYRLSFCCGSCRRRLTPPSVRFLGPKVYLGAVVVLVTAMRQGPTPAGLPRLRELFGADRRTIGRWQKLWREVFPATKFWRVKKALFMPPVEEAQNSKPPEFQGGPRPMTIDDARARFLVQLEADGRSPHTIRQYQRHVRLLVSGAEIRFSASTIERWYYKALRGASGSGRLPAGSPLVPRFRGFSERAPS